MKNLIANSALAKPLVLLALTLLALIPLGMIDGLVSERGQNRAAAAAELADTYAGPQTVSGPFIAIPYTERWTEEKLNDLQAKVQVARQKQSVRFVFPESSLLDGKLTPQQRRRGIFSVQFYDLQGAWTGRFAPFDISALPHTEKNSTIEAQPPVLAFALSDLRGLQGRPVLTVGGGNAVWQPGVPGLVNAHGLQGIHAPLPQQALKAMQENRALDFHMDFTLVGQEKLDLVPLADESRAHLVSGWPHPSFGGKFLAVRRQVGAAGFDAEWAVSSLVSGARSQFTQPSAALDSFGVSLIEPVNVYTLTNRAVKYGLLFVGLTLLAAFGFELLRNLRLHPVQYGLVALAITLFFLLLLALSEKIAFVQAYAIAAGASVALLTLYFSAVLRGWRRGVGLGSYVAALYAALYGLLVSEDNALLLGALLLFGLLSLLMLGTRRFDWYALSPRPQQA